MSIFEQQRAAAAERRAAMRAELIAAAASAIIAEQRAAAIVESEQREYVRDCERAALRGSLRLQVNSYDRSRALAEYLD